LKKERFQSKLKRNFDPMTNEGLFNLRKSSVNLIGFERRTRNFSFDNVFSPEVIKTFN
jgi:hypothetical protein